MFKLRYGYLIGGITTGLVLLLGFFWTLPEGKLHLVFCDVGQGDAAYIRFPDGRDMLVDGGPNNKVLECLGRHMPFWDRHINIVLLSHPQKDHMQGLITVLDRYSIDYFVRSDITNTTEGFVQLMDVIKRRGVRQRFVTTGETIAVGSTTLSILWPSNDQIAKMNAVFKRPPLGFSQGVALSNSVLGASTRTNLNDGSIVFALRYGSFDALFTGDADTRVERSWREEVLSSPASFLSSPASFLSSPASFLSSPASFLSSPRTRGSSVLADEHLEVLKFPHHGSKTGMSEAFLEQLFPSDARHSCISNNKTIQQYNNCSLVVISVGKNSYGHPNEATLATLTRQGVQVRRTDQEGDIEVVSNGKNWQVNK